MNEPVIANYSPNIRWGKQKVEVHLKCWDYETKCYVEIGGNCLGFAVMETALEMLIDGLVCDEDELPKIVLAGPKGQLTCADEEERGVEWLKAMCVSIRIVGWAAPSLNEVRAINGAPPLADGDRPWSPL